MPGINIFIFLHFNFIFGERNKVVEIHCNDLYDNNEYKKKVFFLKNTVVYAVLSKLNQIKISILKRKKY